MAVGSSMSRVLTGVAWLGLGPRPSSAECQEVAGRGGSLCKTFSLVQATPTTTMPRDYFADDDDDGLR